MDTVLIVGRAVLLAVFAVAGVAKLADMTGSRKALSDFRVPTSLISVAAVALPVAELMVAVLVIPASTARVGAALACLLLSGFVAGIASAMRRGEAPDCHCFGQIHSRPAGRETLVRNLILMAVAIVVLAGGGPDVGPWADDMGGPGVAAVCFAVTTAVCAYVALALLRENRRLKGVGVSPPPQVTPGSKLVDVPLRALDGSELHLRELAEPGTRSVLVFTSATCGPCLHLLPELARWRDQLEDRLTIHVVASGDEQANRELSNENGMPLMLDPENKAGGLNGILATPSAVELDTAGRVATVPVAGAPAIEALIRAALKRPTDQALEVHQVGRVG
jgi:uncharacterized membrane protein YphA (DoxX/SURF4 family)